MALSFQKISLKCAIIFLTINGLSPFTYDQNKSVVRLTRKKYLYSLIVTVFLTVYFLLGSMESDYEYSKRVDLIVLLLVICESFFFTLRTIVFFLLHMIHCIKVMELINDTLKINKIVTKFTEPTSETLQHKCENILKIKIVSVILQIVCLLFMISNLDFFNWFIVSYPLIVSTIATTIYLFGGMLMNFRSILMINEKLKRIGAFGGHEIMCDDIEKISILLNKIQRLTTNLNTFYGIVILATLVGSLFLILSSVEYTKYIDDILFNIFFFDFYIFTIAALLYD